MISDAKEFITRARRTGSTRRNKGQLPEDLLAFVTGLEHKEQP
jgi:hypothetical protein